MAVRRDSQRIHHALSRTAPGERALYRLPASESRSRYTLAVLCLPCEGISGDEGVSGAAGEENRTAGPGDV